MPPSAEWTGARVRALRDRLGLSQGELAAAAGYSRRDRISEFERDVRPVPGPTAKLFEYMEAHGVMGQRPA